MSQTINIIELFLLIITIREPSEQKSYMKKTKLLCNAKPVLTQLSSEQNIRSLALEL